MVTIMGLGPEPRTMIVHELTWCSPWGRELNTRPSADWALRKIRIANSDSRFFGVSKSCLQFNPKHNPPNWFTKKAKSLRESIGWISVLELNVNSLRHHPQDIGMWGDIIPTFFCKEEEEGDATNHFFANRKTTFPWSRFSPLYTKGIRNQFSFM